MVFFGGVRRGGGDQKGCIPGCSFLLNAYLRTLFRFYVSRKTPMSRFYYPNAVGKSNKLNVAAGSSFYVNCCFNIKHVEIKSMHFRG